MSNHDLPPSSDKLIHWGLLSSYVANNKLQVRGLNVFIKRSSSQKNLDNSSAILDCDTMVSQLKSNFLGQEFSGMNSSVVM